MQISNSGCSYEQYITEKEKRIHRCCFTGHRPEKLNRPEREIKLELKKEICRALEDNFTVLISGMARGVDIWAAEIVLQLRKDGIPVRLICACPYPGFERNWSNIWQTRYTAILSAADLVRFISPCYSSRCFQVRNEWMVNHSPNVVAVFNGQPSGTKNTIEYAQQQGISVHQIKG